MRAIGIIAIVACAKPSPAKPLTPVPVSPTGLARGPLEHQLEQLEDLTDRACACSDATCLEKFDDDLATLIQSQHEDDPLSDQETWPSDLNAIGAATMRRLGACVIERKYMPKAFGVLEVHALTQIKEKACACTDVACADRAATRSTKAVHVGLPIDDATQAQVDGLQADIARCAGAVVGDQAMLDLKALRKDACTCADATCADDVVTRFKAWGKDYRHLRLDAETTSQLRDVAQDLGRCLAAARGR